MFFLLAVVAFSQPTISPSFFRLGAVLGSTARLTATATITVGGTNQDFDISIRYTSSAVDWLTVTPAKGTAPAAIEIVADPTALTEGTHTAQITAYAGPFHLAAVATVSLVVAPSGINAGGVAVSPSSLTFSPSVSTDPQMLTVTTPPGVTGSVTFVSSATTAYWLSISQLSQQTPGAIRVQASPGGLRPGVHTAAVIITAATGRNTVVPVAIIVPQDAIGSNATLTPAQKALTFNVQSNSTLNPLQTVFITTDSSQYVYFTASATASWLGVAAAAWIPPAATAQCFAPGLFYVAVNPEGLSPGVYEGSIRLSGQNVAPVDLPVTLKVSSTPVLNANPSFVGLDTTAGVLSSNLSITASAAMFFTASVSANTPWLSLSSNTGVASPNAVDLTVTASTTNLPSGTYNGSIMLAGPGGDPTLTIPVQLRVSGAGVTNSLGFSPEKLEFTGVQGDSVPSQYVAIRSSLGVLDEFILATTADGGWLNVELMASPRGFAKATVNSAAAPGLYTGSFKARSLKTGDSAEATVTFRLVARTFAASPAELAFRQSAPGAAIAPQEVQVSSNRASDFRIVSKPEWITVQLPARLTTPATIVVAATPGALAPGQYEGALRLSGPGEVSIPITLTIPALPPPTVSPAAVNFAHELGSPAPPAQSVTVSNVSGSVRFSAQATTDSGIDWLAAAPVSGSTPSEIVLSVNVARVTPGQHAGTLVIRVESTPVKVLTVPITLTVKGAAVQVKSVLNAATLQPSAVSPGLLVTLIGLGLGPETPVIARASSAGAYDTQLADVAVLFDDVAAPVTLVSSERIEAIVPYAIYGRSRVAIQVRNGRGYSIPIEARTVDAAPGVFTQGRDGRGPAIALNADSTLNSVLNPARPGNVVVVYLTGEGQTDPPGQDGRIISTDVRKPLLRVTASIGGLPADVLYAGSAPTMVSGVCQVNLRVPEGLNSGTHAVEIQIAGATSQRGVTIEIQ